MLLMQSCKQSDMENSTELKTVDSKLVFKVKTDQRYKARLCARGLMQQHGIDFTETFAPVVRYDSLRVLLVTVAEHDLKILQFDIQTEFLHGALDKDIFMEVPQGLNVEEQKSSIVCKLEKSLYGLKQAPGCWNQRFTSFLNKFNFKNSGADQCIFINNHNGESVILAPFVDDGLVAAKSKEILDYIIKCLSAEFSITIGDASVFVGLKIVRNRESKSVVIHQAAYIAKMINKFRK